jgi:Kef-type K+ transport system membrane component KefB
LTFGINPLGPKGILVCRGARVSNSDLTSILFILLLLVGLAQLLGYLFIKLRQPKVVGEILAGIVLGPAIIGRLPLASGLMEAMKHQANILNFVYWLGLLLLMFLSGAEMRQLFTRDERREAGWLVIVGTGMPFVLALGWVHFWFSPPLPVPMATGSP